MNEYDGSGQSRLVSVAGEVFKDWHDMTDAGHPAFRIKEGEALAGVDDNNALYLAIVSAIPTREIPEGQSRETTWPHPIPRSRAQFTGIRTGIAFMLAGYRQLLGEEQFRAIIGQDGFYANLTANIRAAVSSEASETGNNPGLGSFLNKMEVLSRGRPEISLGSAKHGIIAAHKVVEQMRPKA